MPSTETPTDSPPLPPLSLSILLARPADEQRQAGYGHTVREIDQQPETWIETARSMAAQHPALLDWLRDGGLGTSEPAGIVLTGSGSSLFVGECLALPLQRAWRAPVSPVPGGALLTNLEAHLAAARRGVIVSFARSGDSPESAAAVDEVLAARPAWRHLIVTCNGAGRLARYDGHDDVRVVVLDDRTCDRSLVMTSSFTNMAVAGAALAWQGPVADYRTRIAQLARVARGILDGSGRIAAIARRDFRSAIFLGSGAYLGAARESALKLLEMSDGLIHTAAETYLGLRHGPMCAIRSDTLVVCFLSSDAVTRAYELDLVAELQRKQLGIRLLVGEGVPDAMVGDTDVLIDCPGLGPVGDDLGPIAGVVVGQLVALFRCLALGLRPDAPSHDNVITRVVEGFAIHRRHGPPAGAPV